MEERTETGGGGAQEEGTKECMPWGEENDPGWVQWRKAKSLHTQSPSTWCLHLRGMSSRVMIQSQDAEGVEDPQVQAPQPLAPALRLNVTSHGLPSPCPQAWDAGPSLHQEAHQIAGASDGPLQLHLALVSPVGQAVDGDVGGSWVSWGEGRDTHRRVCACMCVLEG